MISCCGLDCENCDAYVATKTQDNQLKARVARRWSKIYQREIRPEAVFCNGCRSAGTKGIFCHSMCQVKPCCHERGLDNCAACPEFPCRDLKEIFAFNREAEERLRALRD